MPEETQMEQLEKRRAIIPAGPRGIELKSLNDYFRFSEYIIDAGVAPKGLNRVSGVLIALQHGAEVGLMPMQALQSIYIVNGQPRLYGDAPKAIVLASGLCEKCKEYEEGKYPQDDFKIIVEVKRIGKDSKRIEYSIADAKTAKLWGKEGPWTTNPKRMLLYRARGFGLRDEFPDVLKGFPIKELLDEEDEAFQTAKQAKEAPPLFSTSPLDSSPQVRSSQVSSSQVVSAPDASVLSVESSPQVQGETNHLPAYGIKGQGVEPDPLAGSPNIYDQVLNRLKAIQKSERDFLSLLRDHDYVATEVALEEVSEHKLRQLLEHWDHVERAFKGELL